jgi:hypothetical protein
VNLPAPGSGQDGARRRSKKTPGEPWRAARGLSVGFSPQRHTTRSPAALAWRITLPSQVRKTCPRRSAAHSRAKHSRASAALSVVHTGRQGRRLPRARSKRHHSFSYCPVELHRNPGLEATSGTPLAPFCLDCAAVPG